MKSVKYKHICPKHGIETCHCLAGAESQHNGGRRLRLAHLCTLEPEMLKSGHEPLKFTSERFTNHELYTKPRIESK